MRHRDASCVDHRCCATVTANLLEVRTLGNVHVVFDAIELRRAEEAVDSGGPYETLSHDDAVRDGATQRVQRWLLRADSAPVGTAPICHPRLSPASHTTEHKNSDDAPRQGKPRPPPTLALSCNGRASRKRIGRESGPSRDHRSAVRVIRTPTSSSR